MRSFKDLPTVPKTAVGIEPTRADSNTTAAKRSAARRPHRTGQTSQTPPDIRNGKTANPQKHYNIFGDKIQANFLELLLKNAVRFDFCSGSDQLSSSSAPTQKLPITGGEAGFAAANLTLLRSVRRQAAGGFAAFTPSKTHCLLFLTLSYKSLN